MPSPGGKRIKWKTSLSACADMFKCMTDGESVLCPGTEECQFYYLDVCEELELFEDGSCSLA